MSSRVLIVGSGPSAAYAILACRALGVEPNILSNNPPNSQQMGAFFLHWLPPDFIKQTGATSINVRWIPAGTREIYLRKQGYDNPALPCSFPDREKIVVMYSSALLDVVWEGTEWEFGEVRPEDMLGLASSFDFVFYTFPLVANGRKLDFFPVLDTRIMPLENQIVYSGRPEDRWIRKTESFGRLSFEYPNIAAVQLQPRPYTGLQFEQHYLREITPDIKPLARSEYLAPNVIPIGRYAEWERKRLSHEVYARVVEVLCG